MTKPDTTIAFTHTFSENEIDEEEAQRAQYNWSYPGGLESGIMKLKWKFETSKEKYSPNLSPPRSDERVWHLTHTR
ncbi:MAG: hypothetical protein Ct9H90mP16_13150 [Candidatus Poseidoniales archaeon]|nr:MAG: hypothetical protein Ct9H90mP16_13150 [Candidatus Poseidoniales archaeon]